VVDTAAPRRTPPLTVDEFLDMEEASPTKHEYVVGQVYALAGATERHNRIAGNIFGHLWTAAGDGPCRVYGSDMRVRIGDDAVYYPDVQVVCDPADTEQMYTSSPCLIVEVLSPSTKSIDLREKLILYRGIKSLRAYVIVFRDEMRAIRHYRAEKDAWFDALHGPDGAVPFPCPELTLAVTEIYRGVSLAER
jgi:Uma2 family endonuclease